MTDLVKKAIIITIFIIVPLIATNIVLNLNSQKVGSNTLLIVIGIVLAGFIVYFSWIRNKLKKK